LLLYALQPAGGLYANVLLYLPLFTWLFLAPHFNTARLAQHTGGRGAFDPRDTFRVLREVSGNRVVLAMIGVAGFSALLIGNATQPLMPAFAADLGADDAGVAYSLLLAANAIGAVVGGLLLESTGLLPPRARTAILATILWALTMVGFALAPTYEIAFGLLFLAGVFLITSSSMAQTLVQLEAPPDARGRVIGLFNMAQQGLRIGSAFTVAGLGAYIGIHLSLIVASVALVLVMAWLLAFALGGQRRGAAAAA
jgi:MFS family permease